jgi:hypothetical protein
MTRIGILLLALTLFGCQTNPQIFSEYRYAAYSWVGGNVNDMVTAWGEPTDASSMASSSQPGFKQWKLSDKKRGTRENSVGAGSFTKHACDTIAYYDVYGKIIEIDVQRSKNCDEVYAEQLDAMLRPGTPPPPNGETG